MVIFNMLEFLISAFTTQLGAGRSFLVLPPFQVNLEFYFPYQLLQKTICLFLMLLYRALQIYPDLWKKERKFSYESKIGLS